nr:MAG TPA: hypothetical protein [Bacteriophage sp.]
MLKWGAKRYMVQEKGALTVNGRDYDYSVKNLLGNVKMGC